VSARDADQGKMSEKAVSQINQGKRKASFCEQKEAKKLY
jgi:hypothetical protein